MLIIRQREKSIFLVVFLIAFQAGIALAQKPGPGTFAGQIVNSAGVALSDGAVVLFNAESGPPPAPERYWRVPDFGARIGGDGMFKISVTPGTYFVGIVRIAEGTDGQPRQEDWLYISRDEAGRLRSYAVESGKVIDLGILHQMNFPAVSQKDDKNLTIEGVVTDISGQPVKSAIVEAYGAHSQRKQPLFSSGKTEGNGKYSIGVFEGSYYLRVRARYPSDVPGDGLPRNRAPFYYDIGDTLMVTVGPSEGKKEVNITVRSKTDKAP